MDENNKNIKTRRVGTVTFGIMLILIGISIVLQVITKLEIFRIFLYVWPVIFILLGIEILICSFKKDIKIKYDFWGIVVTFIILFFAGIFSFVNFGVNKVLYSQDFKEGITDIVSDYSSRYSFENNLKIDNFSGNKIQVNVFEQQDRNDIFVSLTIKYKEDKNDDVFSVIKSRRNVLNCINTNHTSEILSISKLPYSVDSIQIDVYTSNKDKIKVINNTPSTL